MIMCEEVLLPAFMAELTVSKGVHSDVMQAYFIFSIGNIRPLITAEYPECWKTYAQCSKTLTQAPDYTQIIGTLPPPTLYNMLFCDADDGSHVLSP